jgi:ribosomal protein L7Ae-like RNA K-turn-binding protein
MSEEQRRRIAGYLGLAQKAGRIAAGDQMVKEALEKNRVHLLVLAADVAESVRGELTKLASERQVTILALANKEELGLIVGKSRRGALGVLDPGFAAAIKKVMEAQTQI